jgi:hypothetical protein
VDSPFGWVCSLLGGKIVSQRGYLDRQEAIGSLEAAE